MQMPIMWPFSHLHLESVKLRIVKLTGLHAPQKQSGGAALFWRMADLLLSWAPAHVAQVTHLQKGHKGLHNTYIYIHLAVLHMCTCFL
jgi:hypothetical protein